MRDFITVYDGDISKLKLQPGEVEQVKWFHAKDIIDMLDAEDVSNYDGVLWMAGTHDFDADYQCMRAVLTATIDIGIFGGEYKALHKWHPPTLK